MNNKLYKDKNYMECFNYHDSCSLAILSIFALLLAKMIKSMKYSLKMYTITNIIPLILFKLKDYKTKLD